MSENLPYENHESGIGELPVAEKVFVEIGPWERPTAADSTRTYNDGNVYIGVERKDEYYDEGLIDVQRQAVGSRMDEEHIILTEGDGRMLHLPDNSVHQLYMGNVLPAVPHDEVAPLLQEAHRVMDGTGPLVMDIGDKSGDYFDGGEFEEDVAHQGFVIEETLYSSGETARRWQEVRGEWPSSWPGEHVFIIARKRSESDVAESPDDVISSEQESSLIITSPREYAVSSEYIDQSYGVPETVVEDVAADLFDVLDERAIDIDSVLIAGSNGERSDAGRQSVGELGRLAIGQDGERTDEVMLSDESHLDADNASEANPIHLAGTSGTAKLTVYDRAAVMALGLPLELTDDGRVKLSGDREQLETAKLLEYHPRYRA